MEKGISSSRKAGSSEPALPHWRKVPKRLDDGTAAREYPVAHEYPATA